MSKIEKLTKQQEKKLEDVRNYWIEVGLNCNKLDRNKARVIVNEIYKQVGLEEPIVVVLDSLEYDLADKNFTLEEISEHAHLVPVDAVLDISAQRWKKGPKI